MIKDAEDAASRSLERRPIQQSDRIGGGKRSERTFRRLLRPLASEAPGERMKVQTPALSSRHDATDLGENAPERPR